jgi:hypothetical protein
VKHNCRAKNIQSEEKVTPWSCVTLQVIEWKREIKIKCEAKEENMYLFT